MPQGLIRAVEEIARPLPRPESPTLTARIAHFLGLTAKQKRATLREICGFLFGTKADLAASCRRNPNNINHFRWYSPNQQATDPSVEQLHIMDEVFGSDSNFDDLTMDINFSA